LYPLGIWEVGVSDALNGKTKGGMSIIIIIIIIIITNTTIIIIHCFLLLRDSSHTLSNSKCVLLKIRPIRRML